MKREDFNHVRDHVIGDIQLGMKHGDKLQQGVFTYLKAYIQTLFDQYEDKFGIED